MTNNIKSAMYTLWWKLRLHSMLMSAIQEIWYASSWHRNTIITTWTRLKSNITALSTLEELKTTYWIHVSIDWSNNFIPQWSLEAWVSDQIAANGTSHSPASEWNELRRRKCCTCILVGLIRSSLLGLLLSYSASHHAHLSSTSDVGSTVGTEAPWLSTAFLRCENAKDIYWAQFKADTCTISVTNLSDRRNSSEDAQQRNIIYPLECDARSSWRD